MNRNTIKQKSKMNSKSIIEYFGEERRVKISAHQRKFYQSLYNTNRTPGIENIASNHKDNFKDDENELSMTNKNTEMSLFKDLLFLHQKEDYANPVHVISSAVCGGMAQSRMKMIENDDILKTKERFKQELEWHGGITLLLMKIRANQNASIENLLDIMKEEDFIECVTKCEKTQMFGHGEHRQLITPGGLTTAYPTKTSEYNRSRTHRNKNSYSINKHTNRRATPLSGDGLSLQ